MLAPGTYSGVEINGVSVPGGVTITSADPNHPAVLTNFKVVSSQGLTFSKLELVAEMPAAFAFQVNKSSDIHFNRISLHGSLDGDASNDPSGLQIMGSSKITVSNSEFQQLARAVGVSVTTDVTLATNHVHDVRSDGFDFAAVGNVKVLDNVLRNFSPNKGDHPDAIQFWTRGTTTPSHDILISGNLILRGEGSTVQGIFMGDEVGTLPLERVTISNNLIVGTGYNAIRLHGAKDATVTDNELITYKGDYKTFLLIEKADGVVATGNRAIAIAVDSSTDVVQSDNVTNKPVNDLGVGALKSWGAAHPNAAALVAPDASGAPSPPAADPPPATVLSPSAELDESQDASPVLSDVGYELPPMGSGGSDPSLLLG